MKKFWKIIHPFFYLLNVKLIDKILFIQFDLANPLKPLYVNIEFTKSILERDKYLIDPAIICKSLKFDYLTYTRKFVLTVESCPK